MKETYIPAARLALHAQIRPTGYLAEVEGCVVRRTEGGIVVDEDSPEWKALLAKYAPARQVERAPYPIPDGFDVEEERRRLKQGGCCGQPSTGYEQT
jgi:hypothetical protein